MQAVLRWEYSLGSTIYLVYARSQGLNIYDDGSGTPIPHTLIPVDLGRAPASDSFLLKWSWYWSV